MIAGTAGLLAEALVLTGLIGWCPAYALLGFNTCKAR